jgi:cell wall-associated NlpC family hydrolase
MVIAEQRAEVLRSAVSWLRTPFVDNAMVKGVGVACGPLLIAVYRSIGIPVGEPKWGLFPKDWHLHTQEERYYDMVAEYSKPVESPEPADMVLFRFNRMDKPKKPYCHGGIVVAWPRIIHAYWGKGVEEIDVSNSPLAVRERVFLSPWA